MAIRTPESILCGHCAVERGVTTCAGCNLQVCDDCAANRLSCPTPIGLDIDVGRGRIRSFDPSCRWALVTGAVRTWQIDLEALTRSRIHTHISEPVVLASGELAGPVNSDRVRFKIGERAFGRVFGELDRSGAALVSTNLDVAGVTVLWTGDPARPKPGSRTIQPLFGEPVTAAAYDISTDRMACASGRRVSVWQMDGPRSIATLETSTLVFWVAIGGDVLAAIAGAELRVWSLPALELIATAGLGSPRAWLADLSAGGQVAVAGDDQLRIVAIDTASGEVAELSGHRDALTALRVADDGGRIASGDRAGHLHLRYRSASGFDSRLAPATLADTR